MIHSNLKAEVMIKMANEELKKQQAQEEEKAPETEAKGEKPEEKA